jgi:hypothetical protein
MPVLSRTLLTLLSVLLAFVVGASVSADEIDLGSVILRAHVIQIHHTGTRFRCVGNAELMQGDIKLDADEINADVTIGLVSASGSVVFSDLQGTLRAERVDYNFQTSTGEIIRPIVTYGPVIVRGESGAVAPASKSIPETDIPAHIKPGVFRLSGASFTACDREKPDYQLTAREIELYPGEPPRLVARGVAVWLGGTRLVQLPNLNLPLSGDAVGQRSLFPKLGFDGDDGFFVGYSMPLRVSDRNYLGFGARGTVRQGFQGGVHFERLLSGDSIGPLETVGIDPLMELRNVPLLRFGEGEDWSHLAEPRTMPSQIRLFAGADYRRKTYDLGSDKLWVSRLPEAGLTYHAVSGDFGPLGRISRSAVVSYGLLSESPGVKDIGRFDARGVFSSSPIALRSGTYLLPSIMARYSSYDTGENYRVLAGSVDFAHAISPESYASFRLIKNYQLGTTPLQVDDVDIETELQAALWYRFGINIVGAQIDYDIDNGKVFDWGLTYGRTFHCYEPRITWRNRFSTINVDVKLLGF